MASFPWLMSIKSFHELIENVTYIYNKANQQASKNHHWAASLGNGGEFCHQCHFERQVPCLHKSPGVI